MRSDIGINATYSSLLNSRCTSCEVATDKSAYWSPTLYYKYPNGSFFEVGHSGAVIYYLGRGPNVNQTVPFPKGFMILSGDKSARSYDNTTMTYGTKEYPGRPIADRVSFNCINQDSIIEKPYMHNTKCSNGMRAQVHFQSCWNGKDLYKQDNSHVAYQSSIDNGICPPSHPVQIPHIFLEILYDVALVPGLTDDGVFVFSQGDPTGYGFHADFQNGWDQNALANATVNCLATDDFGQISNCPVLQESQSSAFAFNCPERPPQIDEPVRGLIDQLPGCIKITYGPEAATSASMNCAPTVPKPLIRQTIDSTPVPTLKPSIGSTYPTADQTYIGCYNDSLGAARTLGGYQTANENMTIASCQKTCNDRGFRLAGVEYAYECHCDNYINPTALESGARNCDFNCAGTINSETFEVCGGNGYISIFNNTSPDDPRLVPAKPKPSVGKFRFTGCLTDPNKSGRALAGPFKADNAMTNELCVKFCLGNFMHYSG